MSKSITLIGLPGCGKTAIGSLLSNKLDYDFIDMDFYIEENQGSTIKEIFKNGEEYFRNIETEICKELGKRSRTIISTGGGVVKKEVNINYLKQNSLLFFIDRPVENILSDLEVEKRPLLLDDKYTLYKLYGERYELYKNYCDYIVENTNTLEYVVDEIVNMLNK